MLIIAVDIQFLWTPSPSFLQRSTSIWILTIFYLTAKIILFGYWFCFFITRRCRQRRLGREMKDDDDWGEFSVVGPRITVASWTSTSWELPSECFLFAFPLTNLRHIAILCTFFFVLSFLSSEIFLLTATSKSESFNFFSFFPFCRLFQLHMFPAFLLMSLSVNFNQFLKQFQSCNFCHF